MKLKLGLMKMLLILSASILPATEPAYFCDFSAASRCEPLFERFPKMEIRDGVLRVMHSQGHPASPTLPIPFVDGAFRFRFRVDSGEGLTCRFEETSSAKNMNLHLCRLEITQGKVTLQIDSPPNEKSRRERLVLAESSMEFVDRGWHSVEIHFAGDKISATIDDHCSLSGSHPHLSREKNGLFFVVRESVVELDDFRLSVTTDVASSTTVASPSHSDSSKAVESNEDRSLALFRDYVEPLLKKHCYECHSHASGEANGGLVVDSRGGLLTGGELGPAVKPGEPQTSLLMKAVLYEDDRLSMPPNEKLSERDIDHLREWIETGAVDPREGPAISSQIVKAVQGPDASKLWSVTPLSVEAPPPIVDMQWPRTDIDRFLLAELETKGLSPSPAAPAHQLLRRLHYVCTGLPRGLRRSQLDLLAEINREHTAASGHDPGLESLIESNELAFRMQSEAPQALDISQESEATLRMYGIGNKPTDAFGRQCLVARRLAESGVRFIQVTNKEWDHHRTIDQALPASCRGVDKPVAGLIADLKSRGLLDDTLVIWSGEFGRTPVGQGIADIGKKGKSALGRGHNPFGWSLFMAGGGVKRGFVHGKTDDFGYSAIQGRVHVHDLHATILHLLGLDHEKLTYMHAGRPYRLTDVYGEVVKEIVA